METINNQFLTVGYIIKTRGLKGVVKVKSTSDFAALRYKKGNKLLLSSPNDESSIEVEVLNYYDEGGFDYVSFKNLEDINLVEKFVNWAIKVDRNNIPKLKEGTYFYCDLLGLTCVKYDDFTTFGTIIKVEDFTSQVSFRIQLNNSKKTLLIPFVKAFVKKVDLENKQIIFHLIDGMLD